MRRRLVVGVTLVMMTVAGCVGPARTTAQYTGKARRTANDAVSGLQTALLAVETSRRGKMLGLPLRVMLQDAEESYGSVQRTFDSIQPPDVKRADDIRDRLDKILSDGADTLAQLIVVARRNDQSEMLRTAAHLTPTITDLGDFLDGLAR